MSEYNEPWYQAGGEGSIIFNDYGEEVEGSYHDAHRIIACVNACAGIPTEALPNLLQQRDQLLAALEALVLFSNPTKSNAVALNNAHKAIASAKEKKQLAQYAGRLERRNVSTNSVVALDFSEGAKK